MFDIFEINKKLTQKIYVQFCGNIFLKFATQ